jgi:hypothetical protein
MKAIRVSGVIVGSVVFMSLTLCGALAGSAPLTSKVVYWADFNNDTVGNKPSAANVKVGPGQTASWAFTDPIVGIKVATDGTNKYLNWTYPPNSGNGRAYVYVDKGVNLADIGSGESLVLSFKFRWNQFTGGSPYSKMAYLAHGWSGGSLPTISTWYQRGDYPEYWMLVSGGGSIAPGTNLTVGHWYAATQAFDFVAHTYAMSVTDLATGQSGTTAPQTLGAGVTNAAGLDLNPSDSTVPANIDIDDIKLEKLVPVKGSVVVLR